MEIQKDLFWMYRDKLFIKKNMADCELCFCFAALPSEAKVLNEQAREAALEGKEFPGSQNTMCAACIEREQINSALDEKITELFRT